MFSFKSSSNQACQRAAQLLVAMLAILLIGKLISLVPVMDQLLLAQKFKAGEIIWFLAKLAALCVFYFFASHSIEAIPNKRGAASFLRGIAEPLTALLLVILAQELFWQVLAPFVNGLGKSIYHGSAILLIVGVSVWLVLRAYRHADQLIGAIGKAGNALSRLIPQHNAVCGQCQAEISSKAHFCAGCGHKVQETRSCAACGAAAAEGQNYCQNCGASLGEAVEADESA